MGSEAERVKLRLIHGGKGSRGPENLKVRLFSAYSIVDDFKGCDCVRLNWICLERKSPLAPYASLIDGYAQISDQVRHFFEQYVKELFTEDEVELLGDWIKTVFKKMFTANEETVPFPSVFIPTPYRQIRPGEPRGFFKPAGGSESDLPFDFCGYYDLSRCPPSMDIQPEAREKGVEFLRESFKELGIEPAEYESALKGIVERMYDERGLLVDRGKTREERIRKRAKYFGRQAPPENLS